MVEVWKFLSLHKRLKINPLKFNIVDKKYNGGAGVRTRGLSHAKRM